ncbi:MAG: hypothetical protein ACI4GA_06735, partial [Acutalibacteraceae bacterium]
AFIISLVICLILRFYHSIKLIDAETGFYSSKNFTVPLFYIVLAAACLFMLIGAFLSANNRKLEPEKALTRNKPLGAVSIILSVCFFTESLQSVLTALYSRANSVYVTDVSYFAQSMKNGYIPNILVSVFAVISAAYFIIFAANCLKKECRIASRKIFALMPIGWALMKLVSLFVKQISFLRVSDLFLEIAAMIFTAIFLLSAAQCVSGVYSDVAQWRITGVGLPAALLLTVLNFPKLCLTLFGGDEHIVSGYPVNYSEFLLGIFIIVLVVSLNRKEEKSDPETGSDEL